MSYRQPPRRRRHAEGGSIETRRVLLALAAGVLLSAASVAEATGYAYHKSITVDRTKFPGTCGTAVTDYPLLFSVTDPDLAHTSSGGDVTDLGGDDIVFRAFDDATCGGAGLAPCTLDHEIESYVSATGALVAWVRIPSVNTAAAASDTVLYVYYGDDTVTSPTENPGGVWDAGYEGVWHLHDDFLDSTANANAGTNSGSSDATGAIANGQSFDGVSNVVYTTNAFNDPQEFTLEAWFRTSTASGTKIVGFETDQTGQSSVNWDRHIYVGTDGLVYLGTFDPPPADVAEYATSPGTYDDGAWHHVVGVRDDTTDTLYLYLDGVEVDTAASAQAEPGIGYWRIGGYKTTGWPSGVDGYFPGSIDEVRVSHTTRSACYVAGSYENQSNPGDVGAPGFYTIGRRLPSGFRFYKPVTVQRARIPGGCGTTLSDYPMLFSVNDPDLAHTTSLGDVTDPEGDDIVFFALDDATCGGAGLAPCWLDHEIERYVSTSGELVAWVRIPSVNTASAASDTAIYVYYGNPTITSSTENPTGVWDANHVGVWHLEEAVTDETTGGIHEDSTSNGNDGVQQNNGPFTGVVADGQDFDGTGDFATIADADSLSFAPNIPFSVSAWIFIDTATRNVIISREGAAAGPSEWDFYIRSSGQLAIIAMDGRFSNRIGLETTATFPTGAWHHVAGTYDGSGTSAGMALYVDGAAPATADYSAGTYIAMDNAAMPAWIGAYNGGGNNYDFDGRIDELRLSNTARSACWVGAEYDNQNAPGDVGAPGFYAIGAAVTAVELLSFTAAPLDGGVRLVWETASETDNLGFHLYRGGSPDGPWERITAALVPGLGSSPEGARYGYTDAGLVNGQTYHYLLEDVETSGMTQLHGPVSATPSPQAASQVDPDADGDDPTRGAASWIRFGDPEASALRVTSRGLGHAVLELTTGGFYALPREDGSVVLRVPGFDSLDSPGEPDLPVRRTWIDAVAGRRVEVRGVRARDVETFDALRPTDAGVPEVVVDPEGSIRAGRRPAHERVRAVGGLWPEQPAALLEVGFQGELKKALVELAPLRWDSASGQLLLARRLEVTVAFAGREEGEMALGGARGRREGTIDGGRGRPVDEARVLTFLSAPAAGAYGVAFEEVVPRERRALRTSALRLSHRGRDVPFHVAPDPTRFGPGSTLFFVSRGPGDNPDATAAVYALETGALGTAMDVRSASPSGPTLEAGRVTRRHETQRLYLAALLDAPDPWLWDAVIAPRAKSFPFDLDRLVPGSAGRLRLDLVGGTDTPESPDHHVSVSINGVLLADVSFDGKRPFAVDAAVPPGVLREGTNALEIHDVGDTGASVSAVYLDRFHVEYDRALVADTGSLEAAFDASGQAFVTGLGQGAVLFDTTDPNVPAWLGGAQWTGTALALRAEAGHRVLAVSPEALLRPHVRAARDVSALRSTDTAYDYVAIGPRDFLDAAAPLLQWRRDQGLAVLEVPTQDLYDAFSGGEVHADAIRDFLSFAFHRWPAPPRYVLLLGDASYDPRGYRGFPDRNRVPAFMLRTPYMWTVSDAAYAAVNGDDGLPDVAIGRLPASDVNEARALALKVLARERDGYRFDDATTVLVADDADSGGDFPGDAEQIARTLLAGRDVDVLRLDELGGATRSAIREAFDDGPGVVSYFGHGGIAVWASENVFNNGDVATLAPQPQQPLLLTMNCLNGYILHPLVDSLAEAFLKAEGRGAVAAFSPSSLSVHASARRYHDALLEEVLSGRHRRLGDALLAAQARYADQGALPDILDSYLLLGDPATSLR